MSGVGTAFAVELRKAAASRVLPWTTGILVLGLTVLTGVMLAAVAAGDERIIARMGPLAEAGGWEALVGTAAQIFAAGGFLACGVAVSWLFGREFADGTVSGLYALPVRRSAIALGKLGVYLAWAASVAAVLTALLAGLGAAAGLFGDDATGAVELARIPLLTVLIACLAVPAGWIASLARNILAGIAATVVLAVVGQVGAVLGIGTWVPLVAPALWAIDPGAVPGPALLVVLLVPIAFGGATALTWARMQLDR